jgi:hypothetical protein
MNIWMYVVRMMEHALDQCALECGIRCDDTPIRAWDQAVAYYTGSLESENGAGEGILLYDLADRMCVLFRTCGEDATLDVGTSYVNNKVIEEFTMGQGLIMKRECDSARASKERIVQFMTIPLIQSTLGLAYMREFYPTATKDEGASDEVRGAVFAATVLPIVDHCNQKDATHIYNNMQVKEEAVVDFTAVKTAFEHSYNCMSIKCNEVGGIWNQSDGYAQFADPCRDVEVNTRNAPGMVVVVVLGVVGVFSSALFILYQSRQARGRNLEIQRETTHLPEVFGDFEIDLGARSFD